MDQENRMPLIGDKAPSFEAVTTQGPIKFPEDYAGKWVILFSHPADFTPVCTTEFMTFGSMIDEFKALNTELVGLSVDSIYSHIAWLRKIQELEWNGKKLNIIDCPGSDDFVGAAMTALNVTDTAILLLNGQYGPEVGTQNHFRYTEKLGKPVIFLVNQLDHEKCDYDMVLEQLRSAYGSKVVPVQYPLATGPNFNSLIDVLLMKKYSWGPEGGAPTIEDVPAEEMEKATELHKALVEAAAEHDESLMEKFFEQESLTEDEMREGIRKGLASRGMFPVFCVCAGKDMGVRRLMEFLGNVVPFVNEMPPVHNTRGEVVEPNPNGPTSLYFFKTAVEPHIGDVQYFKVMSGKVHEGEDFTNADRGSKERIAQIYACAGANRIKVEEMVAGDIGCTVKLKDVHTGNTLNGKGKTAPMPPVLSPVSPSPIRL